MTIGQKQEKLEERQKHDKRQHCKRKRTPHNRTYSGNASPPPHLPTEEEQKAANSLAMPSATCDDEPILLIGCREECAAEVSKEVEHGIPETYLPQRKPSPQVPTPTPTINHGMHECKDCGKALTSSQALGGHRSSHEKVNINEIHHSSENMAPMSIMEERPIQQSPILKKSGVHTCSTCNRQFSSGPALGGHKRCHYIASKSRDASVVATIVEPISVVDPNVLIGSSCTVVTLMQPFTLTFPQLFNNIDQPLDLNLPPPTDDHLEISSRLGVPTTMYVQPGFDIKKRMKLNNGAYLRHNYIEEEKASNQNLDDEAESKEVKLVEPYNLRDINVGEERSTWLQLGIESIADQKSTID